MQIKCLGQCLACNRDSINVCFLYYDCHAKAEGRRITCIRRPRGQLWAQKRGSSGKGGRQHWGSSGVPSAETGPSCFLPASPQSRDLHFLLGSRPLMMTSRWSAASGITWGCPAISLYWTSKELNVPWGTVHKRPTESWVSHCQLPQARRKFCVWDWKREVHGERQKQ